MSDNPLARPSSHFFSLHSSSNPAPLGGLAWDLELSIELVSEQVSNVCDFVNAQVRDYFYLSFAESVATS